MVALLFKSPDCKFQNGSFRDGAASSEAHSDACHTASSNLVFPYCQRSSIVRWKQTPVSQPTQEWGEGWATPEEHP